MNFNLKKILLLVVTLPILLYLSALSLADYFLLKPLPEASHEIIAVLKPLDALTSEFIEVSEISETFEGYTAHKTVKTLPNSDIYTAIKYEFSESSRDNLLIEIPIDATSATVTYYNRQKSEWKTIDAVSEMPNEILHIKTDTEEFLVSPAFMYEDVGTASIEEKPNEVVPLRFTTDENGNLILNVQFSRTEGLDGHFWFLKSSEVLLDFNDEVIRNIWLHYNNVDTQRWTYDGYYYETPSSYTPYSKNMFWRNPASYLTSGFTFTNNSRAASDLSYVMLDTIYDYREPLGYYLTYPESTGFLKKDYNLDAGFYDTRFNTDITRTFLMAYKQTGDERFLKIVRDSLDFFIEFAYNHNYDVTKDGKHGILVEDYYHENQNYTKTHSSLNHHVAEIVLLYEAYPTIEDPRYLELAEIMMQGIRNTEEMWIRDDHSLEYAYMPDGTMGLTDYPYLTYNDLFALNHIRNAYNFPSDATINNLMHHKKIHMDENGITGYKK